MAVVGMASAQGSTLVGKGMVFGSGRVQGRGQGAAAELALVGACEHRIELQQRTLQVRLQEEPLVRRAGRSSGRVVLALAQATSREGIVDAVEVPLKSDVGISYEALRDKLAAGQWEAADDETRRLICVLAGEGAAKRKWVYFSEVSFIPASDLLTIDTLWRTYSNDKFGFSVQRRMWKALDCRWKPFFLKIGWTYGENSTYKKFPLEFTWEIDAPVGHLPLTNALRGTLLFEKLLTHPAFDSFDEEQALPTSDDLPSFDGKDAGVTGVPESTSSDAAPRAKKLEVLDGVFDSSDYGF